MLLYTQAHVLQSWNARRAGFGMALRITNFRIDTHGENVAYLPRACTEYRPEEFLGLNKIEITPVSGRGKTLLATLDIVDDPDLLEPDTLALSTPAFRRLGLKEGAKVKIRPAVKPLSLEAVRKKIYGAELSGREIREVVEDIAAYRYSRMEIAAFLIACASFMTVNEILHLTKAMAGAGATLKWDREPVVDKHCVGGVPGNRTSMLVVPIVAAHGLTIPKTSSRAITSPAGTADTMEVLTEVSVDLAHMRRVVRKLNGCLVWGGKVNLSPADDIMISVERPLGIDTPEQMVASILSKKLAAGSTHLVIDIPVGPTVKARDRAEGRRHRKLFEHIAREVGMSVDVVFTDGSQPVGFGIGPVLEARDVMAVLERKAEAPQDLRERALMLAGRVLEFDPALPGGKGLETATEILDSGKAYDTMNAIIEAQGRNENPPVLGRLTREIKAAKAGTVAGLDCWQLARIARAAGAPQIKGAGVELLKKVGDAARKGEPLYRIYSGIGADFDLASQLAHEDSGATIARGRA